MNTIKTKQNKELKHPNKKEIEVLKKKKHLENACIVFEHTFESASNFLTLYNQSRSGKNGTTSHPEQDLLRAMLLFTCAGLDSTIKHLIEDNLSLIIEKDINAQRQFEKYVEKILKKNKQGSNITFDNTFIDLELMSEVIASSRPRDILIKKLKKSLSNNSLQSLEQILTVASHFAITSEELLIKKTTEEIKKTFNVRNEISHEMDVDLTGKSHKKRRERTCNDMMSHSYNILSISFNFIKSIDIHLSAKLK
jgi:hypothetical protein